MISPTKMKANVALLQTIQKRKNDIEEKRKKKNDYVQINDCKAHNRNRH